MEDREPSGGDDLFRWYMRRNDEDLKYIRERVDKLWDFRLMLIGGSLALGAIGGLLVQIVSMILKST